MKTALKLSKKELLSLYEKSSEQVRKILRTEFGSDFFLTEKAIFPSRAPIFKDLKIAGENEKNIFLNWEAISDLTPIFRMLGYTYLLWLIF